LEELTKVPIGLIDDKLLLIIINILLIKLKRQTAGMAVAIGRYGSNRERMRPRSE
jgi:hypothetical protein